MPTGKHVVYADAFGAVPNPDYDSGPAIQEAINSLPANIIGTVMLGEQGVYATRQPINITELDGCYELRGVSTKGTRLQGQCSGENTILNIDKSDMNLNKFSLVSHVAHLNNGIKVSKSRCYIDKMWIFPNGYGISVNNSHSVYIKNCMGATQNVALKNTIPNFGTPWPNKPWILLTGTWNSQIVIRDNINESMYSYAVKSDCTDFILVADITGNQFEAMPGIYLSKAWYPNISTNYLSEGAPSGAYPIWLSECLYGDIKSNFIPYNQNNTLGTIYLYKSHAHISKQFANRVIIISPTSLSNRVTLRDSRIYYIQNELLNPDELDLINVYTIAAKRGDKINGNGISYGENVSNAVIGYPYTKRGDKIYKRLLCDGISTGFNCVSNPNIGQLNQIIGSGPAPIVDQYFGVITDSFRVTITTGGPVGIGSFKVYRNNSGAWSQVNVAGTLSNATMYKNNHHHYVDNYLSIKWPENQDYVEGNTWEFQGTMADWLPMPPI